MIQRRRGQKIVQYTDGREQVIEQRTSFLLPILTLPKTLRACDGPSSLMSKPNCKEGDVVDGCYNIDLRCCDYPVSRSVRSCIVDDPVIALSMILLFSNEQF